ncbi:hypothetical protein [Thauera butanivorans]|uniref:hypothetical protein n=1 Tax=Thauera butanivorans TaxID=86174 RepID=UPI000838B84E|nr:hypothetical protein [Thauera butanivorans]
MGRTMALFHFSVASTSPARPLMATNTTLLVGNKLRAIASSRRLFFPSACSYDPCHTRHVVWMAVAVGKNVSFDADDPCFLGVRVILLDVSAHRTSTARATIVPNMLGDNMTVKLMHQMKGINMMRGPLSNLSMSDNILTPTFVVS